MNAVAKEAGVGIGTLYRHFSGPDLLIEAVYESELEALSSDVTLLLEKDDAFHALRRWMGRYAHFAAEKRAIGVALQAALARTGRAPETRARLRSSIAAFVAAGSADGTIREDANSDDIAVGMAAMVGVVDKLADPQQLDRLLDLIMDALRPATATRKRGKT